MRHHVRVPLPEHPEPGSDAQGAVPISQGQGEVVLNSNRSSGGEEDYSDHDHDEPGGVDSFD